MRYSTPSKTALLIAVILTAVTLTASHVTRAARERTYGSVTVDSIVYVYDGDTFFAQIRSWPAIVGDRIGVRIAGIDTPEMRDKNAAVALMARQTREFARAQLEGARVVELRELRRDKYFRLLADVYVDGRNLAAMLIDSGLARPYDGGTKTQWSTDAVQADQVPGR